MSPTPVSRGLGFCDSSECSGDQLRQRACGRPPFYLAAAMTGSASWYGWRPSATVTQCGREARKAVSAEPRPPRTVAGHLHGGGRSGRIARNDVGALSGSREVSRYRSHVRDQQGELVAEVRTSMREYPHRCQAHSQSDTASTARPNAVAGPSSNDRVDMLGLVTTGRSESFRSSPHCRKGGNSTAAHFRRRCAPCAPPGSDPPMRRPFPERTAPVIRARLSQDRRSR